MVVLGCLAQAGSVNACPTLILSSGCRYIARLSDLRAFLTATMRGDRNGWLHWLGVHCSSFITTSRGSTGRSLANPEGCQDIPAVHSANKMAARPGRLIVSILEAQVGYCFIRGLASMWFA